MDQEQGIPGPFLRSSRVLRSPTKQRSSSVTDVPHDTAEVEAMFVQVAGKKRKAPSPQAHASKRTAEADTSDDEGADGTGATGSAEENGDFRSKYTKLKHLIQDTIRWADSQHKSKKIVNQQLTEIKAKMGAMTDLIISVEQETYFMAGRLTERANLEQALARDTSEGPQRQRSFAEMVKTPRIPRVTGGQKVIAPKVIFVRSENDDLDVNEVKEVIKRSVRPGKLGVNVRRVIKTARGVMIEAENTEQLEKLKTCKELSDKGLAFDKPKKRQPRLMIYDVDPPEDREVMIEDIYDQNMENTEINLETFKREFKIIHEYKRKDPKDPRVALVVECTAQVRNAIRNRDRIFIGWQSCRLKDYNPLVRCYKCQGFGHVAKYCKNKTVCPHCADGHEQKDCGNKNRPARCANCLMSKKDCNHPIGHPKCPEYIRATKIAFEKIDYGS